MFSRKPHHFKHEGTINKVYKNGQNNITVRQNGAKKFLINYQKYFKDTECYEHFGFRSILCLSHYAPGPSSSKEGYIENLTQD